jgi:mannose-6-phosphate isomerase-like protein (cupin superfamily)
MNMKTEYINITSYTTKDGSIIREFCHPDHCGNKNQSLAEAIVPPGFETFLHKHNRSEEIYHITEGAGLMTINEKLFEVKVGDTVCIMPGEVHRIKNVGNIPLKILCCCAPPYSHEDTEIINYPA